jgi:hypothetical protein
MANKYSGDIPATKIILSPDGIGTPVMAMNH